MARSHDADDVFTVGESYRKHVTFDHAEAVVALLPRAVREVLGDDSFGVREGVLRLLKWNTVLSLVFEVLPGIPIESDPRHAT